MALPLYLAMTAAEMRGNDILPPQFAYMACLFSPYGTGLSNCPKSLPEGSLLILNDRTPIHSHDHSLIAAQLQEMAESWAVSGILLDFQRPDCEETAVLTKHLVNALPCPVGVSDIYGNDLDCPVFLPPVPLDLPSETYLTPWQGREIWLEAALEGLEIQLTEAGASSSPLPCREALDIYHRDPVLHCHYACQQEESCVRFTLRRRREDLEALLEEVKQLGVTRAVGLWQELSCRESSLPNARLSNS